ncbi:unnamed protein product [Heligmosomoides polygyrus]|uniref:Helicase ATP-binding domain-containing protein n=1 Tax=Heligmosomoides polygyrus TaxID=6339 RepID=A0A183G0S9_HELPZ|nr:unnamed protein product [Heligmosomoides polygyrus]
MVCDAVRDFAISGSNIPVEEDRFTKFFIDQSEKIRISPPVIYPPFAMEDLDTTLVENLRRLKYNRLLPVQSYAISVILSGISGFRRTDKPLVLILGNTQNLMAQTFDFACKMAGYSPDTKVSRTQVRILDLYMGGTSSHRFQQPFEHEIVVATTGGIKKAISLSKIDLSALQLLILDEADKMVDSRRGFGYDVAEIFSMIPDETRANINVAEFSATFAEGSDEVYLTELDRELFQ